LPGHQIFWQIYRGFPQFLRLVYFHRTESSFPIIQQQIISTASLNNLRFIGSLFYFLEINIISFLSSFT
jgi:hypothetical protein